MISKKKSAGVFLALKRDSWETRPFPSGEGQRSIIAGDHLRYEGTSHRMMTSQWIAKRRAERTYFNIASLSCRIDSIHFLYILLFKSIWVTLQITWSNLIDKAILPKPTLWDWLAFFSHKNFRSSCTSSYYWPYCRKEWKFPRNLDHKLIIIPLYLSQMFSSVHRSRFHL